MLDFIFNHTSDEHEWAVGALAGKAQYNDFYYLFPDRRMPDVYDKTLREIFPDAHAGSFSQLADGRWVWTTFNSFQWDLNYSNPAVFTAMAAKCWRLPILVLNFSVWMLLSLFGNVWERAVKIYQKHTG